MAATTGSIPHPYEASMAEAWISSHEDEFENGNQVPLAIDQTDTQELIGAIGLILDKANHMAELGYWIGKPFWNRGYATEASWAVIEYGFSQLNLNRIFARHMTNNPASGRVLLKAGMQLEGVLRQSMYRWGSFEDSAYYSILRQDYLKGKG